MRTAAQVPGVREENGDELMGLGELAPTASVLPLPPMPEIVYIDDSAQPEPARAAAAPRKRKMRLRRRWVASAMAGILVTAALVTLPREFERNRSDRCRGNIERIGRALLKYKSDHGTLPPAFLTNSAGQPLLSWRVAILPYLGRRDLYDRFRFDEAWDSPHNMALLAKMPDVFACPSDGRCRRFCRTPYLVVVGPEENLQAGKPLFERTRGVDDREILDGTFGTLMVAESNALVPWTKPDDLAYEVGGPLPDFGRRHQGGFNVVFAGGNTRRLSSSLSENMMRAMVTRDGLEAFDA